ncbi:MAG: DUF4434 domain-containing protein [Wenzhouxiangellaceae bacterium]|nr:DUF4434 domain-containing protein [Wenzhouxiangellaceae bacterium]
MFGKSIAAVVMSLVMSLAISLAVAGQALAAAVFYQPQNRDAGVAAAEWRQTFEDLRRAGHDELVVQWTRFDSEDFGGADGWLSGVVDQALEAGIRVRIGLAWDSAWFARLEAGGASWQAYFNGLLRESYLQAGRWQAYRAHPGFAGWYLPLELPDRGLTDRARQAIVAQQLGRLRTALDAPLAVSSYFTGFQPPSDYANWVLELGQLSGVEVWVQDGAGTGRLTAAQRDLYLDRLDCSIGIVHEAFVQVSGEGESFAAEARAPELPDAGDCHAPLVFSLRYLPQGLRLPGPGD